MAQIWRKTDGSQFGSDFDEPQPQVKLRLSSGGQTNAFTADLAQGGQYVQIMSDGSKMPFNIAPGAVGNVWQWQSDGACQISLTHNGQPASMPAGLDADYPNHYNGELIPAKMQGVDFGCFQQGLAAQTANITMTGGVNMVRYNYDTTNGAAGQMDYRGGNDIHNIIYDPATKHYWTMQLVNDAVQGHGGQSPCLFSSPDRVSWTQRHTPACLSRLVNEGKASVDSGGGDWHIWSGWLYCDRDNDFGQGAGAIIYFLSLPSYNRYHWFGVDCQGADCVVWGSCQSIWDEIQTGGVLAVGTGIDGFRDPRGFYHPGLKRWGFICAGQPQGTAIQNYCLYWINALKPNGVADLSPRQLLLDQSCNTYDAKETPAPTFIVDKSTGETVMLFFCSQQQMLKAPGRWNSLINTQCAYIVRFNGADAVPVRDANDLKQCWVGYDGYAAGASMDNYKEPADHVYLWYSAFNWGYAPDISSSTAPNPGCPSWPLLRVELEGGYIRMSPATLADNTRWSAWTGATSGQTLPRLYLLNDARGIRVDWRQSGGNGGAGKDNDGKYFYWKLIDWGTFDAKAYTPPANRLAPAPKGHLQWADATGHHRRILFKGAANSDDYVLDVNYRTPA